MPEQETAGRQPGWALIYALHDAFRRDLGTLRPPAPAGPPSALAGPSSPASSSSTTPPRPPGPLGFASSPNPARQELAQLPGW